MSEVIIEMIRAKCLAYTFDEPKLLEYVQRHIESDSELDSKVLNLFAGKNIVINGEFRVDLDPSMPKLDYCGRAEDYIKSTNEKFDYIFYDPPWRKRKSKELYGGRDIKRRIGLFTRMKDDIVNMLTKNGVIISLGYQIDNFGKTRRMNLEKFLIVNPSGEQTPFYITFERKMLTDFEKFGYKIIAFV